jgi:hypothetical protein
VSIWGAIVGILLSRAPRITQLDKLRDRFLDKRGARAVRVPVYCFFFSPTPEGFAVWSAHKQIKKKREKTDPSTTIEGKAQRSLQACKVQLASM